MKTMAQQSGFSIVMAHKLWQSGLVILLAMLLSGCNLLGNNGTAAKVDNSPIVIPEEVKATKTLLEVSAIASLTRTNPFATLLVKPEDPQAETAASTEPAPVIQNPFEGVSLGGIIFREKKPLAILALPSGKSKIVHVGDMVTGNGEPLQVKKITKNSIRLSVANIATTLPETMHHKTLNVASLIGYQSPKTASSSSGGSTSGTSSSSSSSAAPASNSASGSETDSNYVPEEIKSLMSGNTSSAGASNTINKSKTSASAGSSNQ